MFSRLRYVSMNKSLARLLYLYLYLVVVLPLAAAGGALSAERTVMAESPKPTQGGRSEPLPRPRDPDIAVQEEFDSARARATVEAWELFLARHGNHRLATEARKELQGLQKKR